MELAGFFPEEVKTVLSPYLNRQEKLTEIRFRVGKPVFCYVDGREEMVMYQEKPYVISQEQLRQVLLHICKYSVYAYEEERKNGYITLQGGHRLGLSGQFVYEEQTRRGIRNISGINFRVSHEKRGISKNILHCCYENGYPVNLMIISPPGLGKTTLLRDLIRNVSNGCEYGKGRNVSVIDERSELGGSFQGVPQNDLGLRTDCLDGISKREGIFMAIRSLTPEVLAVDEVGGVGEESYLLEALHCGVKLFLTMHGDNLRDVQQRNQGNRILKEHMINRFVEIGMKNGIRSYHIRDENGKEVEVVM